MKPSRSLLTSFAGAALIIALALLVSGHSPLFSNLRHLLSSLPIASQTAATALGVTQGLPSYSGYPSPSTCNTGDSLCYPYTRIGVFSITSQANSNIGTTNYINLQNTTGSLGTPVVLQKVGTTTVEWSCQNSQSVGTQVVTGQAQCGCTDTCGSWPNTHCCTQYCNVYGWQYATVNFATNAIIADPQGGVMLDTGGTLYGTTQSLVLGGPAGTYTAGQTVNYSLSCVGGGSNPVTVPVTMGSTITQTSVAAAPNPARAGLDQVVLTVNFSQAVAASCTLSGPAGVIKSYGGTSAANDLVTVGPFQNTDATPQVFTLKCTGPEGFNSIATASVVVSYPPNLGITANNTPISLTIPAGSSADIRWTSSNQKANSCSVTYTATGGSCAATAKSLATTGAYGMRAVTIGTDTYLAVANAYNGSYNANSNIYKWISGSSCFGDGTTCGTAYQTIATNGAAMWESFVVGTDTYLAVANSRNDVTRNVNSKIYKWLPSQACFGASGSCGAAYQSIPTSGAVDLKPIVVGTDTYLAVANYRNDSSYTINSNIYRWMSGPACFGDGTTCGAVLQAIPTQGAYRMESYVLGGESYLAVTSAFDGGGSGGVGYNLPSYIYKYTATGTNCPAGGGWGNGNHHTCGTPYQTLNTSGAYEFKFFTIGNVPYLGVANAFDGANFNINSKIYQWMSSGVNCPAIGGTGGWGNGTTCGAAFQLIPTSGATSLNTFVIGANTYLIAANAYSGTSYNVNSNIYQWMQSSQCFGNGGTCGVALQAISTSGAAWWEPMVIGGTTYLGVANYFNGTTRSINSSVMQWSPNGCSGASSGAPTVWTGDQSPANGFPTGIFTGSRLYTLTCKWLDGTTASSTSVTVSVLPQLTLSANGSTTNPVYITPNTSALIQWASLNIQSGSCAVTNTADSSVWSADNNSAGYSSPVLSNGQQITYTLACSDLSGNPINKSMTVIAATPLPPSSGLSLSASRVIKGARPAISWNAQNLSAGIMCGITPALQGGSSASNWNGSGTSWTSPVGGALGPIVTVATTFTLTCTNLAGNTVSVSTIANLIPSFKEI